MRKSLFIVSIFCSLLAGAQSTSTTTGNWNTGATWGGSVPTAGADVIIATGTTVTIDVNVDINNLTVEAGGVLNVATATGPYTLNISGDLFNLGTITFLNGTGEVNTTFDNTVTAVISGTGTSTFNDLSIDGANVISNSAFTVSGDFAVGTTVANLDFSANNQDLIFLGNFTLANSASFSTVASTTNFDGTSDQTIDLANGSAIFNNLDFDGSSRKSINGDLTTNGGTVEVFAGSILDDQSAGNSHTFYNLEVNDQNALDLNGSTVYFLGGEIRFGANTNEDGTIDFGEGVGEGTEVPANNVNLVFVTGTSSIERDDQLRIDGDVTIQGPAQFVINGTGTQVIDANPVTNVVDATMTGGEDHTLTMEQNGDIYLRGQDNFPRTFGTFSFAANSIVRYDESFDQTVRGLNSVGSPISFARVLLSDNLTTKTLATGESLTMTGQLDINGGTVFATSSVVDLTIGGSIFTNGANANFNASSATLRLNGTENQTLDAFDGAGRYDLRQVIISNPDGLSRTVNIDDDIQLTPVGTSATDQSLFQLTNPTGNSANLLTIDIDANTVRGSSDPSFRDELNVGANTRILTSGDLFADEFNTAGSSDISTFDVSSTIRFDGGGNQAIPSISGSYGSIEFNGNGDKYLDDFTVPLVIAGNVTRIGGGFVFNYDQFLFSGLPFDVLAPVEIQVAGDWNLTQASLGTNGVINSTINFNGTDQNIAASDFEDVTFSNGGTKTIQGNLEVLGDLSISTGVTVTTLFNINTQGNWTEASGAAFQQTGGTVTFNGGVAQSITAQSSSYFFDFDIENGSTVTILSDSVRTSRDFDMLNGTTLNLGTSDLRIGRRALFDNGSTLSFTDATATVILDGDVSQDFDNEIGGPYPTLSFAGVGEKDLVDQNFDVDGNFLVASGTTVNGNGERIDFSGSNWTIDGVFTHANVVDFDGASSTVSASDFNDIEVSNGTTVTLAGNINLEDDLTIEDGATLNAAGFSIQLEDDWNNYGTFTPGTGTVTFVGNASQVRTLNRTSDPTLEDQATAKAFYNLTINNASGQDVVFEDDEIQNGTVTVSNNLLVESGNLRLQEDAGGTFATHTFRVGGDLTFSGGVLEYQDLNITTIELYDGAATATNTIDLGGNQISSVTINGTETYEVNNTFTMIDDLQSVFTLNSGTLDLNGQIMFLERGGMSMTGGQFTIDEGATLVMDNSASLAKSGGNIDLTGQAGNPATITNSGSGNYTFTQTSGDFEADNYVIANTSGDGIDIQGGTIQGFANGLFTNGAGTSYLTIQTGVDIGTISAPNVVFNAGPTYNVNTNINNDGTNVPNSGTITFIIAGGTLSGSANENDDPDGGDLTGFVQWQNEPGFTWTGLGGDTDWSNTSNWTEAAGPNVDLNGDNLPNEATDVVFIQSAAFQPLVDEVVNIGRLTVNSGSVTINGGSMDVDGNFTVFNGASFTIANSETLNIAGSFANDGTFTQNTGTLTFDGTDGSHSINNNASFSTLVINGGTDASYGLGSAITITNSFQLLGGNFDASSGFTFNVEGDWTVSGGTFIPGVGRVNFNRASGNQNISGGTINNARFSGAGTKTFTGNISIAGDVDIQSGSGQLISNNTSEILIFVGDDWVNNNSTTAFAPNDGTVVLNGQGGQDIEGSQSTTFNNIIFQGSNVKNINISITVNGDMTLSGPEVDVNSGITVTGTGTGTLSMSTGVMDIEGADNFPSSFGTYNLIGGLVRYITSTTPQTIRGGLTYNNLEMRAIGNNDVATKSLSGDITVNGSINISNGDVTFDAGANTVTIVADNAANTNHLSLGNDDNLSWSAGGTLVHSGTNEWDIEADLAGEQFQNITLTGGRKDLQANLIVNGNLTVGSNVNFDQNTFTITNSDAAGDGDTFTLGASAYYENNVVDNGANDGVQTSLPDGFQFYELAASSTVDLDSNGEVEFFTSDGNGQIAYGNVFLFNNGNANLDGNLLVEGNFDMNDNSTLVDNGNDITFNGGFNDLQNFVPTGTITFSGADQSIVDQEGGAVDNLNFATVIFGGTGTKTLTPNDANNEVVSITSGLTIQSGVSVTTDRRILFSGSTFSNSGSLALTNAGRPLIFDGTSATIDVGTNNIGALTLQNAADITLTTSSLDIGNGDITINDGCRFDFGDNITHNIASDDIFLNTTGQLEFGAVGTETTIVLDRTGNQRIPFINATSNSAQITGIPNITFSGTGEKLLTGDLLANDITIEASVGDFDVDQTNEYAIEVRGSWDNQGAPFTEREGQVLFYATDTNPKTITTAGDQFSEVQFDGTTDRTYTLVGDLLIEGEGVTKDYDTDGNEDALTITRGTLDLNGNTLTLGNDDTGDPEPEVSVIEANGRIIVGAGAILQLDTRDDNNNTDADAVLDVYGRLDVDGDPGNPATVTRGLGGDRVAITIYSGGTIEADNYNFNFLADAGLRLLAGANLASAGTFSNGAFNNIATDNNTNTYLSLEIDLASDITIDNVAFNFDGNPNATFHSNVTKTLISEVQTITFTNTSGNLGSDGESFDVDPDDKINWPAPTSTTWEGDVSNDWFTATNWTGDLLPTDTRSAIIPAGTLFNPTLDLDGTNGLEIAGLSITDGILRVTNSEADDELTVSGDVSIGDGTVGVLITETGVGITVTGSFEISANATYDNGSATITLNGGSNTSPIFSTGTESVGNVSITGQADYQFNGTSITIDGNLTSTNTTSINPLDGGYTLTVGGNLQLSATTTFNTGTDGDILLNATSGTQTVENLTADGMIFSGAGLKTLANVSVNDIFTINSGATVQGLDTITWLNDVIINGTFNGASGISYAFAGDDWIAGSNAYGNEFGTVVFTRNNGDQYIRQSSVDPVEFHGLTFRGTVNMNLGRFVSATQEDGNINMTGDLTVENTIGELRLNDYQITAMGAGSQTMILEAGERIELTGSNNFPDAFTIYNLDATSTVSYQGTIDQTVRGGLAYGTVNIQNGSTTSLGNDVDINGDLIVQDNSILDVTTNNYLIRLAGRFDTEDGTTDGSFLARDGTVILDGTVDQIVQIGNTGTQDFNILQIDKTAGFVDFQNANYTIFKDLIIEDGQLDINFRTVTIGGLMDITGSGSITSDGTGLLLFNAAADQTIKANGSVFPGNVTINAPSVTYTMLDDFTIDNVLTVTAGTLEVNGNRLEVGNAEDVINIFGTLNVSTVDRPGGTLALGNQTQLVVQPGGVISVVGTPSQAATVTRRTTGSYGFTVGGTAGNAGTIAAQNYVFEFMNNNGINISENGAVDVTNNFSSGSFANGLAGGVFLRIENDQEFLSASSNQISNVVFADNPGGGAVNVAKTVSSTGVVEFENYTGAFSGETFDSDPNNLIVWLDPSEILWTGTVSSDWYNPSNWSTLAVPTETDDVVIPSSPVQATLFPPVINNDLFVATKTARAEVANLTVENGNSLTINTSDAQGDLRINGALTLEVGSTLRSLGTADSIRLGGNLVLESNPSFIPGTGSTFTFEAESGLVTLGTSAPFNNLIMDVDGSLDLTAGLTVNGNFLMTDTSGVFNLNDFNLTVNGNFDNQNPNAGAIVTGTGQLRLTSSAVGTYTVDPGASEYYDIVIGDASTATTYQLTDNLSLSNNLTVSTSATLDPNGNDVSAGDSNADAETFTLDGNLTVGAGEALNLGNGTELTVNNGANFQLNGDPGNVATLTRKGSSGSYTVNVAAFGEFGAQNFAIAYVGGSGINLVADAILTINSTGVEDIDPSVGDLEDDIVLRNGSFSEGQGTTYLTLADPFSGTLKSDNVTFNANASNPTLVNITRNGGSLNPIVFVDPAGSLQGPNFESDDQNSVGLEASTGNVQWFFNNPLLTWTGASSTDFNTAGNWEDASGSTATVPPNSSNTVVIPDVSGASNRFPVISTTGLNVGDLTINASSSLTINSGLTFTATGDFTNAGSINLDGSLIVNNTFVNTGSLVPGASSSVTINVSQDGVFNGGSSFNDLTINADADSRVISTSGSIDINGDFNLEQGQFVIADPAHTLTIGGNLTVTGSATADAGADATLIALVGTIVLDGISTQTIDNTDNSLAFNVNNLTLSGGSTKIINENTTVNGELIINDVTTSLDLGSITLTMNGDLTVNQGSINAGTSTVIFGGTTSQRIGGTIPTTFNNLTIDNSTSGNNDLQLAVDVNVGGTLELSQGVIVSSSSNILTIQDNAVVTYDGVNGALLATDPDTSGDGTSYVVGPMVKIGDENFVFPTGQGARIARIGITDIGGTTSPTDSYSAEYFATISPDASAAKEAPMVRVSGLEYWDLTRTGGAGQPRVTLFWDATSQVTDPSSLRVAHFTGVQWDDEDQNAVSGDASGGYVSSLNLFTSFSPVTLGTTSDSDNPLPVELLTFTGIAEDNNVRLEWATASELNNDFFDVQRSRDGVSFESIGRVAGNGTTDQVIEYTFIDQNPGQGENYYRLRQVDYDGTEEIHKVIRIVNEFYQAGIEASVYPNPSTGSDLNVQITTGDDFIPIVVQVVALSGHVLHQQVIQPSLRLDERINVPRNIQSGLYFVVVKQGNNTTRQKLIIK